MTRKSSMVCAISEGRKRLPNAFRTQNLTKLAAHSLGKSTSTGENAPLQRLLITSAWVWIAWIPRQRGGTAAQGLGSAQYFLGWTYTNTDKASMRITMRLRSGNCEAAEQGHYPAGPGTRCFL
jgi:hypothetical protein